MPGGADHLADEDVVFPCFVVGVSAGNLVDDIDHQGIAGRFGRRRGTRRRVGGNSVGGEKKLLRLASGDAVGVQAVVTLKRFDRGFGHFVIAAGNLRRIKAQLGKAGLYGAYPIAGVAVFHRFGKGKSHGRRRVERLGRGLHGKEFVVIRLAAVAVKKADAAIVV